jgi:hypothetical protein
MDILLVPLPFASHFDTLSEFTTNVAASIEISTNVQVVKNIVQGMLNT